MASDRLWTYREPAMTDIDLVGYSVEAADGSTGSVEEASYEVGAGYLVVDGSSWRNLGLGTSMLVPAGAIERVDHGTRHVYLSLTRDQLKRAPRYGGYDAGYHETATRYFEPYVGGAAAELRRF
jgi:hypothetical protein